MNIGLRSDWLRGLVAAAFLVPGVIAQGTTPMINGSDGHTIAVDRFGNVYAWGANTAGQLGDGTNNPSYTPNFVPLSGIVSVAAGGGSTSLEFSLAVASDGTAFAWGYNGQGQLGLGNTNPGPTSPTQIPGFSGALMVVAGANFAAALKKDGTVWAWGDNGS